MFPSRRPSLSHPQQRSSIRKALESPVTWTALHTWPTRHFTTHCNHRAAQGGLLEESKAKAAHGDALSASESDKAKMAEELAALQVIR